jgi:hypothetical protein
MAGKTGALLFGVIFIIIGVLGFVDNPLFNSDGVFYTNKSLSGFHIIAGIILFVAALLGNERARTVLIVFGFLFLLLGLIGLITIGGTGSGQLLGIFRVNGADNILYIMLGVLVLLVGIGARRDVVIVAENRGETVIE